MTNAGLLRVRGEDEARVTPIELFFDLVYVLAVTQLTHHLLSNLSLRGAGETPTDAATVETTALILGGPALYLVGNALFKWSLWERVPWTRLVAIGALAALIPVATVSSALVLSVCATAVVVALAVRDTVVARKLGS